MSVIRLRSTDIPSLVDLADKILVAWRGYTDADAFIFAETDGTPHNTITPIARTRGGEYELDLVLRNNITTDEHPLGVYHPHSEYHNIKKENIGLIEVMGLAVLPARLKDEIELMCSAILNGKSFDSIAEIEKHGAWFDSFKDSYEFTADNVEGILKTEIGKTFVNVLRDAGVYKDDVAGRAAFMKFIDSIG
jgi:UDPglucose--hexose-1-phosphate uridylyltransferase